jgi:uncharacterized protein YjbI with pentapeptide repeats
MNNRDGNKWGQGTDAVELGRIFEAIQDDCQIMDEAAEEAAAIMAGGTLTMAKLKEVQELLERIETHASVPLRFAYYHLHNLKAEREANSRSVSVTRTYLIEAGADLKGADLEGVDLEGADLEGADLRGANLKGANLKEANLKGANLEGADFTGARLDDVKLHGAKIRDAVWPALHAVTYI